jgi:NAD(P)-dependent dehydrogenase (short-subunit alcohol dehydrogenase family)
MPTYLIIGASRGIGRACAEHLAQKGDTILSVSRSPSDVGIWIKADIGTVDGVQHVLDEIGDRRLDGLLFLGGIWENGAFTDAYDFLKSPVEETLQVIAVNLTAPILLAQGLVGNLEQSDNARIVLIGSTSGLTNSASPEVANTASKFGLQGAGEALNEALRGHGIATTVVNPANVATQEVFDDIETGAFSEQVPIPLSDITATLDYVLTISRDTVPGKIDLLQTKPGTNS